MVIAGKGENATGIGRDQRGKRENELNKGIWESFGNSPSCGEKTQIRNLNTGVWV